MPPYAGRNSWFFRRIVLFFLTGLFSGLLVWLALYGVQDGRLHLLLAEGSMWALVAIMLTYVGGASVEDLAALKIGMTGSILGPRKRRAEDKEKVE